MGMLPTYAPKRVDLAQLYFNAPAPPQGLSAPHQTSGQRLGDYISGKLENVVGKRFAKKVGALPDYSPVSALTTAFDLGSDMRERQYGSAAANAVGTALNAIPDVGPIAKGMFAGKAGAALHSIIAPLFHGSPHKFEKFALEKIGTGEGNQAYGHGLYFAEHPQVAKEYRQTLAGQSVQMPDGRVLNQTAMPFATAEDQAKRAAIQLLADHGTLRAAKRATTSPGIHRELDNLAGAKPVNGHLYEVKLDANPEDFLNWDAGGQDAYDALAHKYMADRNIIGLNAEHSARQAAANSLRQQGVPGIRYLDQGSRGAGQGTSNYVVFDPSIIDILNRH